MRGVPVLFSVRSMSKLKKPVQKSADKIVDGPVLLNKNGEIVINVLAKPGAKVNTVTDISVDGVGVQIAGKPVDGEANAELLKFMTSLLGLKKNEISLDKGSKSRHKVLIINKKDCTVEHVVSRLKEEIG